MLNKLEIARLCCQCIFSVPSAFNLSQLWAPEWHLNFCIMDLWSLPLGCCAHVSILHHLLCAHSIFLPHPGAQWCLRVGVWWGNCAAPGWAEGCWIEWTEAVTFAESKLCSPGLLWTPGKNPQSCHLSYANGQAHSFTYTLKDANVWRALLGVKGAKIPKEWHHSFKNPVPVNLAVLLPEGAAYLSFLSHLKLPGGFDRWGKGEYFSFHLHVSDD